MADDLAVTSCLRRFSSQSFPEYNSEVENGELPVSHNIVVIRAPTYTFTRF